MKCILFLPLIALAMAQSKSVMGDSSAAASNDGATVKPYSDAAFPVTTKNGDAIPITDVASTLWSLDTDRLLVGRDIKLNVNPSSGKLFKFVDKSKLTSSKLYTAFIALLDNYEPDTATTDTATPPEKTEQSKFLDLVLATGMMKFVRRWLNQRGVRGTSTDSEWKTVVSNLWFYSYGRDGGRDSSSGFEHTFVGELSRDYTGGAGAMKVAGFHNWVVFSNLEAAGTLRFDSWRSTRLAARSSRSSLRSDPTPNVATISFAWEHDGQSATKPVSSMLIGASPAFEVALYTLFLLGGQEGDNECTLGDYRINVRAYPMNRGGRTVCGSSFPSALTFDGEDDGN